MIKIDLLLEKIITRKNRFITIKIDLLRRKYYCNKNGFITIKTDSSREINCNKNRFISIKNKFIIIEKIEFLREFKT